MKRRKLLIVFAISVFFLGIAAGRHLQKVMQRPAAPPIGVVTVSASAMPANGSQSPGGPPGPPGLPAGEATTLKPLVAAAPDFAAVLSAVISEEPVISKTMDGSGDSTEYTASDKDPPRRQSLLRQIAHLLPDLTPGETDEWANQLIDLSPDDALFLLQQKQRDLQRHSHITVPASLSVPLERLLTSAPCGEAGESALSLTARLSERKQGEQIRQVARQAMSVIRRNLLGSQVPGFRSQQVFLVAPGLSESTEPVLNVQTRFSCAGVDVTGDLLHVALPADSQLMFRLQAAEVSADPNGNSGSLLTRSGRFCRLGDGALGWCGGGRSERLRPAMMIPETAGRVWVTESGEVRCQMQDGEQTVAGRIIVVEVSAFSDLTSRDGVLFRMRSVEQLRELSAEEVLLLTRSLELSNVDSAAEWALLDHFRRLADEAEEFSATCFEPPNRIHP